MPQLALLRLLMQVAASLISPVGVCPCVCVYGLTALCPARTLSDVPCIVGMLTACIAFTSGLMGREKTFIHSMIIYLNTYMFTQL